VISNFDLSGIADTDFIDDAIEKLLYIALRKRSETIAKADADSNKIKANTEMNANSESRITTDNIQNYRQCSFSVAYVGVPEAHQCTTRCLLLSRGSILIGSRTETHNTTTQPRYHSFIYKHGNTSIPEAVKESTNSKELITRRYI